MEKRTYVVTFEYGDPVVVKITEETYNFIEFLKSHNDGDLCGLDVYPAETYKDF